ncbi:MAG: carboxypeptidase-like regulatory domain-containing protein, partial [Lutibacter sp.]|nr:carboxypeptidase-like regulatory domain-containing protein [Lutibacter sp.]
MKNFLFLILIIPLISISQNKIQGIVIDSKSKQPLPFASIITNTNFGTLTDVDGEFHIKAKNSFHQITISYVGYQSVTVSITE